MMPQLPRNTQSAVINQKGQLTYLEEKNGNSWRQRVLDGNKIDAETEQKLIDAIQNNDGDAFRREVFHILTGKTVQEATK